MKTIILCSILGLTTFLNASAQNSDIVQNYWQIGLGLGELPIGGSFKLSITFGYHFNEKVYTGIIYQIKDKISRDESSFNAKSAELDGLINSSETVAQRFILQFRYTPLKYGPYLSTGFVFNGKDSETMFFDERIRSISGEDYTGSIKIQQTRPAGCGLALGVGYQYNFKNGVSLNTEWTPAWFQYPEPSYSFIGDASLSDIAISDLEHKMDEGFKSSVTNMYKVFHIGFAYKFN